MHWRGILGHRAAARLGAATAAVALAFVVAPGLSRAGEVTADEQGDGSPLEQAREESGLEFAPPSSIEVPGGVLGLSSELLAGSGETFRLWLALDRPVQDGSLDIRLPRKWLRDSQVSDLPFANVPQAGRAPGSHVDVRRDGELVRFSFDGARSGERARFELSDVGIPAGTYELPYRWREQSGATRSGTVSVVFYAPVREQGSATLTRLPANGTEINVTNDAADESETFVTAVPGNKLRFIVGANGGGYNAWITNDGGANFTRAPMPTSIDAPGNPSPEASTLCCDPMSAADAAGNIWYGGLSLANGASRSRIVVSRIAPGASAFQPQTVGLPVRTSGTQDKPMMTIDNSPASPTFGRLYVIWDEPATGGVNVVVSTCETRPAGVSNPANCDNADNWTTPVSVTPATGSYIYADVAVGPDGKVYAVWWNYSSANAIQGDVCDPATQACTTAAGWSAAPTVHTTATLDATGGTPVPFACPILAQPGGRASTSPQIDVDRSDGPNNGRAYVTWSDLRTGSGTTRCDSGLTPLATHLTWDNFVASAANSLPGSASPSPDVATRLLTDGEGGGQANSDDWFSWLAVDQTTGQAWADFYSTRDDAARRTTNFYVRSVTPSGAGHTLGALTKVSSAPSDYSTNPCCTFGNDYGDYTGLDATQGVAIPVWSDKRSLDGEAYSFVEPLPSLAAGTQTVSGGDGDGALEPGESFQLTQRLANSGLAAASGINSILTESNPDLTLTQASSTYPDIAVDASQPNTTPFAGSLGGGASCGAPVAMTLQLTTDQGNFNVPVSVPTGETGSTQSTTVNPSLAIPDADPNGVSSTISLSGPGRIRDLNARLSITHTWDEDLRITLSSPASTQVVLSANRGGSGDNYTNTVFDDEAATAISAGSPPFSGSFRPETPLSAVDGELVAGNWTLKIVDSAAADTGTLGSWGLDLQPAVCSAAPVAPQITDTDPNSPANDNTPEIKGTAAPSTTVKIYSTSDCSGPELASGTTAQFASPGITVSVPADQTTNLRATATDGSNLTSACSSAFAYTEDSTPPETTLTSGPRNPTNDPTPTFAFSSNEPGSSFVCKVDTGASAVCASPHTTAALGDGSHSFEVRATDAAGNADLSPASSAFMVDTRPPVISRLKATVNNAKHRVKISFVATDPSPGTNLATSCQLDRRQFTRCTSPRTFRHLRGGRHKVTVRARDAAGNSAQKSVRFRLAS